MGGSLLSKFRWCHNMIAPWTGSSADSKAKLSRHSLVKEQAMLAEKPSVASLLLITERPNDHTSTDYISVGQVLKSSPAVMKAKILEDFEQIGTQVKKEASVLESAREFLAAQSNLNGSPNTVTPRAPVDTRSVSLGNTPGSTAFEILLGEQRTVCAAARLPRRLRKLDKVSQLTAEGVAEKMKAVEEKRLKALERTRATAKVKEIRHPAEDLSRITAKRISDEMSKADLKRNKAIERKRKAGRKASRSLRKIADAQAYTQVQIKSSIEQKRQKCEMKKVQCASRVANRKRRREAHAQRVKEKAKYTVPDMEPDVPVVLQLEVDELYYASDSDDSWCTMESLAVERKARFLWKDPGF